MFSHYKWKTEGSTKKRSLACKEPCNFLLHIPVCAQAEILHAISASMRAVSKITAESYCTGTHGALSSGKSKPPLHCVAFQW